MLFYCLLSFHLLYWAVYWRETQVCTIVKFNKKKLKNIFSNDLNYYLVGFELNSFQLIVIFQQPLFIIWKQFKLYWVSFFVKSHHLRHNLLNVLQIFEIFKIYVSQGVETTWFLWIFRIFQDFARFLGFLGFLSNFQSRDFRY
jgi:hypothetical protein